LADNRALACRGAARARSRTRSDAVRHNTTRYRLQATATMAAANNNKDDKTVLGKRRSAPASPEPKAGAKRAPDAPRKKAREGMSKGVYYIGDPCYLTSAEDDDSEKWYQGICDYTCDNKGYTKRRCGYVSPEVGPRLFVADTGGDGSFGEDKEFSVDSGMLSAVPLSDMPDTMRQAAWAAVKAGHAVIEPIDGDFTCMAAMQDCGVISWMRIGPCFYDLEEDEEEEDDEEEEEEGA